MSFHSPFLLKTIGKQSKLVLRLLLRSTTMATFICHLFQRYAETISRYCKRGKLYKRKIYMVGHSQSRFKKKSSKDQARIIISLVVAVVVFVRTGPCGVERVPQWPMRAQTVILIPAASLLHTSTNPHPSQRYPVSLLLPACGHTVSGLASQLLWQNRSCWDHTCKHSKNEKAADSCWDTVPIWSRTAPVDIAIALAVFFSYRFIPSVLFNLMTLFWSMSIRKFGIKYSSSFFPHKGE